MSQGAGRDRNRSKSTPLSIFPDDGVAVKEEKVKLKVKEKIFSPCVVCGDKSSGLHYKATTCEGCKAGVLFHATMFRTIFSFKRTS